MKMDRLASLSNQNDIVGHLKNLQSEMDVILSKMKPEEDVAEDLVSGRDVYRWSKLRLKREAIFGSGLFADPAWDMFLELYRAHLDQKKIFVSSLCIAAAVPPTTALRWIKKLESEEWITRSADPLDGRRFYVRLTQKGLRAMRKFFSGIDNDTIRP